MKVLTDKQTNVVKYISNNVETIENVLIVDGQAIMDGDNLNIAEVVHTEGIFPLKHIYFNGLFSDNPNYKELPKEITWESEK